ncbi:hypothetical protein LTR29_009864 [Friedmanniomyces endolithicus]|nr:hypothetical protein LTR29_009864 [Friedmanniomyces endolithicus]
MPAHTWHAANGATLPHSTSDSFTITAHPITDIWRRDATPEGDVFNAPYIYTTLTPTTFSRLAVKVTVPWKTQFDQGGLLIAFPSSPSSSGNGHGQNWRWIKAGIEMFDGKPALGVVGTDRFSDWSLAPMPGPDPDHQREAEFEAVRDGTSLWVYVVVDGERRALREVKWAFLGGEEEVRVGVYAAKPTPDEGAAEAGVEINEANSWRQYLAEMHAFGCTGESSKQASPKLARRRKSPHQQLAVPAYSEAYFYPTQAAGPRQRLFLLRSAYQQRSTASTIPLITSPLPLTSSQRLPDPPHSTSRLDTNGILDMFLLLILAIFGGLCVNFFLAGVLISSVYRRREGRD